MSKYVLFSPIGNHDPFGKTKTRVTEGPLLHIVRHYKPEVVILFLTKEMYEKNKDNRYANCIKHFLPDCKIEILEDGFGIINAHNFDEFIKPYNGIFTKINEKYPDYEIIFNASSGTPQMISGLILEAQISKIKTKAIQVVTPKNKGNNDDDTYTINDIEYIEEDYENKENRCVEPNFNAFKQMQLKSQIKSLIQSYEYRAAIDLIENTNISESVNKEILNILYHCCHRLNLNIEKAISYYNTTIDNKLFEYYYTIKVKQLKGELADFALKLTPILTEMLKDFVNKEIVLDEIIETFNEEGHSVPKITRQKLQEYDDKYQTDILDYLDKKFQGKDKKGKFRDNFVNTMTLNSIIDYFKTNKYVENNKETQKFCKVANLFSSFTKIEQKIRNATAHEMIGIDEEKIKSYSNKRSGQLLYDIESILVLEHGFPKGKFVYDELNQQIIEIL